MNKIKFTKLATLNHSTSSQIETIELGGFDLAFKELNDNIKKL
jgi:hypothetical protein